MENMEVMRRARLPALQQIRRLWFVCRVSRTDWRRDYLLLPPPLPLLLPCEPLHCCDVSLQTSVTSHIEHISWLRVKRAVRAQLKLKKKNNDWILKQVRFFWNSIPTPELADETAKSMQSHDVINSASGL